METTAATPFCNRAEARRLYQLHTGGTGNIDRLWGRQHAETRRAIISALAGRKVPLKQAGWHIFRNAILNLFGVAGDCIAEEDSRLREVARVPA